MKPTWDDENRKALEAFLATAPEELRGWASEQLAQPPITGHDAVEEPDADGLAAELAAAIDGDEAADIEDLLPEYERPASAMPDASRKTSVTHKRVGAAKVNLVLVVLLCAAVVIIIQQAGRNANNSQTQMPANHPSVNSSINPSDVAQMDEAEPVDSQLEADLKAKAEADPNDIASRQQLGQMYLKATLYQDAISWFQQILDISPSNLDALLAIGVAEYQSNMYTEAETHWRRAAELAPDVAEPWYNLGFLYMAQTPPNIDQANECWNKVLEVAPDSEMAAAVRSHQSRMNSSSSPR